MPRVTKPNAICRRLLRSANQTPELVTGAARRDIPSIRLSIWRVAAKTGDVCVRSGGDREPDAATISAVTRRTRSFPMFRVIEPRIETAQCWKRFNLSTLNVRVTDRADHARRICELLRVTACARRV